jgi:2-polyprenyl-3-methyl-5-hydroxy-6-metoxy-1,4-benzoquinol methylase
VNTESNLKCKMCNSENLELFLDLGDMPKVDRFLSSTELNEFEPLYPLTVYMCKNCGLAQLGFIVPASELFDENYAYESSTTANRRKNHYELAEYTCNSFKIKENSLVVDIGSNVGVLLEGFKNCGMKVVGVDASSNIVKKANKSGIETILGFFDEEIVNKILNEHGNASIITATNVFAHIQNYELFIIALKKLLRPNGIFVFQVPHFLKLIKNTEYDTIYHEHISYFGLKPLITFFEKNQMELFDVIETEIDGGSIRCFVANKGTHARSSNVDKILADEIEEGIYKIERLKRFEKDVKQQNQDLNKILENLKKSGKKVVGVGAPAKGITLINYCKIDKNILEYITEKAPLKIGKFCPGTHIPIVSDEKLIKDKPDYAIIFAWNFAKEIMSNLEEYRKSGGKFLIPIPTPKIV